MKIEVRITEEPLEMAAVVVPGCGAIARFDGIVRETEDDRPITALEYEAYRPMAENLIHQILAGLSRSHPFELARIHHRLGVVPVGEAAIILDVHSRHRGEAFAVVAKFMDRLKVDVPIWKVRAIFSHND